MGIRTVSFLGLVMVVAGGIVANPANACIRGPLPLTFVGKTAALDEDDKFLLKHYGRERPSDMLQVIFYQSAIPTHIVRERQRNVRAYLTAIARPNISVVQSKKPLPRSLAEYFGYRPTATVEALHGCF